MTISHTATPSHKHPRILLIDADADTVDALKKAGFNVATGSFGIRVPVPSNAALMPLNLETGKLPHIDEQEIVIVNLRRPAPSEKLDVADPGQGVPSVFQSAIDGAIDPRPLYMAAQRDRFDHLRDHGTIFIIILAEPYSVDYVEGAQYGVTVRQGRTIQYHSWQFLSVLDYLPTVKRNGIEIDFLEPLLRRGAEDSRYRIAFSRGLEQREEWTTLARNKFGEPVAGRIDNASRGTVLLLPQMPNLHLVISSILEDWCSQWSPQYFPDHGSYQWLQQPEYELPAVNAARQRIAEIESTAAKEVEKLSRQIEKLRCDNPNWYALLNGTGRELVVAVIDALRRLGFRNIVDVDSEADPKDLREDIQILDSSPKLIVDVKGVVGTPEDAESNQSQKHALMRSKEFSGDVKALTIINSQRNVSPHQRNQTAYRPAIIDTASQQDLGLMTTWDLYLLLKNKEALGWDDANVAPIFYRSGRIEPIPSHYSEAGRIVKVWESSFGIVPTTDIKSGARLAIEFDGLFSEVEVESINVDKASVAIAVAGSNCGIRIKQKLALRKGMRVFLIT